MKNLFLFSLMLSSIFASAQISTKPKTIAPIKPATPAKSLLKNLVDSASYAMGMSAASFYKEQGITNINTKILSVAINDILSGKKTLIDETAINTIMNKMMTKVQEDKAKPAIDSGMAFLARNKKRPGVKTTASGLQYEIITEGTGIKPAAVDTFVCHYRGTLLNGTEFDASYTRNQPLTMAVNQVIRGWTEGLQLMNTGSKYKFYIPYNLAYGPFDNGAIPGGSTLIFEVELLAIKPAH